MKFLYLLPEDHSLFNALIREGISFIDAVKQLLLIGISPNTGVLYTSLIKRGFTSDGAIAQIKALGIEFTSYINQYYHIEYYQNDTYIPKKEPRKKLPYYYGNRRY